MFFSRTTNRVRLGQEEFLGLPCWRYEWVKTNLPLHSVDGESFTREVQFLFLANPTFPLVMRMGSGGSWNTNRDVREIKLGVPISEALFEVPKGLKVTKQFQVPGQPFELVLRETRSSSRSGWSTLATTSFSCDGEIIKATRTDVLGHRPSTVRGLQRPVGDGRRYSRNERSRADLGWRLNPR